MANDLNRRVKGRLGWAALGLVFVALLAIGGTRDGGPQNQRERIDAISQRLACPTCNGESVYESRASSSENLRREVARLVADSALTDDQIVQRIDDSYVEDLTLTPDAGGLEGVAWVLPVVVAVLAVGGLVVVFRRWRATAVGTASDEDKALVAAALDQTPGAGTDDDTSTVG